MGGAFQGTPSFFGWSSGVTARSARLASRRQDLEGRHRSLARWLIAGGTQWCEQHEPRSKPLRIPGWRLSVCA